VLFLIVMAAASMSTKTYLQCFNKNVSNTFDNRTDSYSHIQCFLNTSLAVFQLVTVHEKHTNNYE